ncbi:site-specific integrase [Brevibacillus laterosporus]|uniref:Site-specific integrase n=1 Tax=Brevibacillus laterosporus TaxID=1465 RepID=A0AAP3DJ92_BRELA|nr:site-specific integrase [Brevibacillus laterosporus]MCR8980945.1 site-specific integrase [Brevibacillus laterosporus]MCZ0808100.1 site-specific integrase [Brevibacillus laterosporus]MCZ0826292.1 site-specific integrase [Brevibacillus laterosporus]MCZ0850175.1 site-specific integrase [Brevibacillus laterosporus]
MKGHVRKRGDKWCFVVELPRDESTGKRKQKWFSGFTKKKDAEQALTQKLHELQTGLTIDASDMTVSQYMEYWLENYAKASTRPTTHNVYEKRIKRYIIPRIGRIKLKDLKVIHLQKMYTDLLKNGAMYREGGISPITIRHIHGLIHKALQNAERWQMITRNVARLVELPRVEKKETIVLTREQVQALVESVKGKELCIPVLLAVTTGMRYAEVFGLAWKDIDFEKKTIHVKQQLVRTKGAYHLTPPKTKSSERIISLSESLIGPLKQHKAEQAQSKLLFGPSFNVDGLVCCRPEDGLPYSATPVRRKFRRVLEEAGVPDIRIHDLRHTVATLLLETGVHPKIVSELLGHANIGITLDRYSHVSMTMQQEAIASLENAIFFPKNAL